jgi:hypothetical protein
MIERERVAGTVGYLGGIMSLPEPFVWSWTQMIQFNAEVLPQIHYTRARLSLHSAARNELYGQMQGDWLLQLDTDLVFDPDFVARLVRVFEMNKLDILTGVYPYKSSPQLRLLYMFNKESGRHEPIGNWENDCDLIEVDAAGGGCLIVRRHVFETIIEKTGQSPFEMIPPYGEDFSFFMRARKCGFKAYCAHRIQAAHLAYRPIVHEPMANFQVLNQYPVSSYTREKEQ